MSQTWIIKEFESNNQEKQKLRSFLEQYPEDYLYFLGELDKPWGKTEKTRYFGQYLLNENEKEELVCIFLLHRGFYWNFADNDARCNMKQVIDFVGKESVPIVAGGKRPFFGMYEYRNAAQPEKSYMPHFNKEQWIQAFEYPCFYVGLDENHFQNYKKQFNETRRPKINEKYEVRVRKTQPTDEDIAQASTGYGNPEWMQCDKEEWLWYTTQGEHYMIEIKSKNSEKQTWECIGGATIQSETEKYGLLNRVCIKPEYRSLGLAQVLVEGVCDALLARKKIPVLFWEDKHAGEMYNKWGFSKKWGIWNLIFMKQTEKKIEENTK